ncbi:MAG: glycosyltransferase family 2 protein [Planctomycetes bacterium]|nr:glycosyltransferase family 2 protein [Planctomycetota bacterium]
MVLPVSLPAAVSRPAAPASPIPAAPEAPAVAVVVPCFRYAHFLGEAVGSVVAQSYRELEIVVVDDGSPDDTAAVAQALIERHPQRRIRLVRQTNQGLAAARNAGIRASTAPLILPLDADDRLLPNAVERLVAGHRADPSASVVCPFAREFGDRAARIPTAAPSLPALLRNNRLIYASLFTRTAFDMVGGYNPNMRFGYEDWDFWVSVLERGGRIRHLPEELILYRKHGRTMLAEARAKDVWLRARLVLNHPSLFSRRRRAVAERVLALPEDRQPGLALRLAVAREMALEGRLRAAWRYLAGGLRANASRL